MCGCEEVEWSEGRRGGWYCESRWTFGLATHLHSAVDPRQLTQGHPSHDRNGTGPARGAAPAHSPTPSHSPPLPTDTGYHCTIVPIVCPHRWHICGIPVHIAKADRHLKHGLEAWP